MGKSLPQIDWRLKIDGRLKVTGEALCGSDFLVANSAYGILVTSSIAKGRWSRGQGYANIGELKSSSEIKLIKYRSRGGGPRARIWMRVLQD